MILGQDLGQIAQPPPHHTVYGRRRSLFDQRLEDIALVGVQARTGPGGLAIDQPVRSIGVEGHDPVAHRLQPDPADLGPAGLRRITRPLGQTAQGLRIEVRSQRHRSSHRIFLRLQTQE
ncbi:hypothetical protein ASF41_13370 [Methylobacterium sp. Leaf111]|nr:hypothetical protein ASF41_13370 [Methylobacterium sp. Leaf111]